jgi:hypothetical protein
MRTAKAILLTLAAILPAWSQLIYFPSTASSQLYFPQLADGGPAGSKWATTIIVVNQSSTNTATVAVKFYGDDGKALALDFGSGASATLNLTIPAGGTKLMTSTGAGSTTNVGWGLATSNVPVTGTILYEARQNGSAVWDVAAAGTATTYIYNAFATYNLGIAVANPSGTNSITLKVSATDAVGANAGTITKTLPPNGHASFNLGPSITGMAADFTGSITIRSYDNTAVPFIAWAVNVRDGLLSPLPPGEMNSPSPFDRKVSDMAAQIRLGGAAAIQDLSALLGSSASQMAAVVNNIQYTIDSDSTISASYSASDKQIHLSKGMIELLGDSRSAIAFLFAHMATLAVQAQVGVDPQLVSLMGGVPLMADTVGMVALMKSGLDPFGAFDFYGRLQYAVASGAAVSSGVQSEFALNAVSQRLSQLWLMVGTGCTLAPAVQLDCEAMHRMWHPDVNVSSYAIW